MQSAQADFALLLQRFQFNRPGRMPAQGFDRWTAEGPQGVESGGAVGSSMGPGPAALSGVAPGAPLAG